MRYNHIRYAAIIIKEYNGSVPLSTYLKDFFKANPQMGSRDRKTVSELVYGYYRLGHLQYDNIEERINDGFNKSPMPGLIFPWLNQLSDAIDVEAFNKSFLIQPDLFIRVRPGKENLIISELESASLNYYECGPNCIGLPNSTKIDQLISINRDAVIQDKSSQKTGDFLKQFSDSKVWDCCAASGGKSIMAYDMIDKIDLTVSDLRPSIISNLKERFAAAGIQQYKSFVADLTDQNDAVPEEKYDLIIADVPCSGSGTWSRTPEQLFFFKEEKIDYYQQLQQRIVSRVSSSIKPGGYLLYITCSVFRKENEEQVKLFSEKNGLQLIQSELFSGYTEKADTLFAALFKA